MKLVFLDIDGVLNDHDFDPESLCGRIHHDKMKIFNHILRHTGAMVVLSSAWRYIVHRNELTLAGIDWLLRSHGMLANRLIGITREDTMCREPYNGDPKTWPMPNERGEQIAMWLSDGEPHRYVVIDDLDLGISEWGHPFVQTDGKVGLTVEDADRVIALLANS